MKTVNWQVNRTRRIRRRGFTLIECMVYLVLIGILATTGVVTVGNLSDGAKFATHRNNLQMIDGVIRTRNAMTGELPNNLSSIFDSQGNVRVGFEDILQRGDTVSMTLAHVDAMRAAGITRLFDPEANVSVAIQPGRPALIAKRRDREGRLLCVKCDPFRFDWPVWPIPIPGPDPCLSCPPTLNLEQMPDDLTTQLPNPNYFIEIILGRDLNGDNEVTDDEILSKAEYFRTTGRDGRDICDLNLTRIADLQVQQQARLLLGNGTP